MIILAFETSAKAAGVALLKDGALLAESMQNSGLTHSRTLMQMAQAMLIGCGLGVDEIDAVAAASGPGSFTGVRIGVAAAKGFCWGRQIPCVGVSTLEAMVRGAAMCDGVYCACMDARREQVYNAIFRVQDGKAARLSEDRAISLDELRQELKNIEEPVFLVGDGALLCYNSFREEISALRLLPEHLRQQRAAGVALAAKDRLDAGQEADGARLIPNYLRLSQAERERQKKNSTAE